MERHPKFRPLHKTMTDMSRLLQLPAELRNRIIEYALTSDDRLHYKAPMGDAIIELLYFHIHA